MNALTAEWIAKEEGDYATAGRELRVSDQPNYDAVCFHAQQTIEKYLKAFLQENRIAFPKTHSAVASALPCHFYGLLWGWGGKRPFVGK